ncbi:MAG: hypothetical protein ACR2MQ_15690 [Gemmatimonadaceae bacterium]
MVLSYQFVGTPAPTATSTVASMLQGHLGVEAHGPLGTLWASIGLIAFYIGLIWINSLLGLMLTPLLTLPATRLLDVIKRMKGKRAQRADH